MRLLKGTKIAEKSLSDLKKKIKASRIKPGLAAVLVGKNPASEIYVRLKAEAAKKVGIVFYLFRFGARAKEGAVIKKIKTLNTDKKISGIIVQLPLPKHLNKQKILETIDPQKDADGVSLESRKKITPAFSGAIMKLISAIPRAKLLESRKAAIIAKSEKFGEAMKAVLRGKGIQAEYILYKNFKESLTAIARADIVITAVGQPGIIKGEMLKKGAVVIDGGIAKQGKKVLGDADFESVKKVAGYLSPVPGGVGPVTVACLLENVYLLAKKQKQKNR